jgi:hypothetical protein
LQCRQRRWSGRTAQSDNVGERNCRAEVKASAEKRFVNISLKRRENVRAEFYRVIALYKREIVN